jgi:hypothetical protein
LQGLHADAPAQGEFGFGEGRFGQHGNPFVVGVGHYGDEREGSQAEPAHHTGFRAITSNAEHTRGANELIDVLRTYIT